MITVIVKNVLKNIICDCELAIKLICKKCGHNVDKFECIRSFRLHPCQICGKDFVHRMSLRRHLKRHKLKRLVWHLAK